MHRQRLAFEAISGSRRFHLSVRKVTLDAGHSHLHHHHHHHRCHRCHRRCHRRRHCCQQDIRLFGDALPIFTSNSRSIRLQIKINFVSEFGGRTKLKSKKSIYPPNTGMLFFWDFGGFEVLHFPSLLLRYVVFIIKQHYHENALQ